VPLVEYRRQRAELERLDAALAARPGQLTGEASRVQEVAGLAPSAEVFARRVSAGLGSATFAQRRQLVELLINRVVVTGDTVEIRYVAPAGRVGERDDGLPALLVCIGCVKTLSFAGRPAPSWVSSSWLLPGSSASCGGPCGDVRLMSQVSNDDRLHDRNEAAVFGSRAPRPF
jgi:hypothetical protein